MESNRIQLEFSKTMANLVGDRFGRTTFGSQVKDKFDETKINVAVIPDRIEDVATSFIQGFYSSLSENKGKEYALKRLRLETANSRTMEKINFSIEVYGI